MKYREAARRLGLRWMRRRSQKGAYLSWSAYHRYLERYTLPMPGRLTDLIAGDEDAVMPGEKCQLGAGCVNGARPVLRGFGCTIGQGSNIGTPQRRNPWQQGKTKCILNPRCTLLLARTGFVASFRMSRPLSPGRWPQAFVWAFVLTATVIVLEKIADDRTNLRP